MSRIFLSAPDVTEVERGLLLEAFDSGWISSVGASLDAFEAEVATLAGVPHAVALSSGTAGLHLALLIAGVQPGDEVYASTFTFVATANAIRYCGATPVFIDSDETSWNIDPSLLADALADAASRGRLPKAVVAVDLYGQCADYDAVEALCAQYEVALVEDAAEALGAAYRGKPAGGFGRVGVFSFNGNKIATTSGGGMVVTDDAALASRVRHLATQAREKVVHYEHLETGYNYRLSNLLAAVGLGQVRRLPQMIERRHQIHARYREGLAGIDVSFMPVPEWSTWNGWLTCAVFASADEATAVRHVLDTDDIESRPLWKPMHLQPAFDGCRAVGGAVSEQLFRTGLCLPSGSGLNDDEIDRVIDGVLAGVRHHQRIAS